MTETLGLLDITDNSPYEKNKQTNKQKINKNIPPWL